MRLVRSCVLLPFILLLCFVLRAQESMSLLERRINCQIDSATVEQILEKVVTDNDLFFSYNPDILPREKSSVQLFNVTLGELLRKILTEDKYKTEIIDNQVIITLKEVSSIKLSGIIVEGKDDTPVPFASLTIAGESIGTMTNIDGRYDFIIPWRLRDKMISVRCLGFQSRELTQNELMANAKIRLESVTIHLREITVKPVVVTDVLKNFRNNIEKNYELSTQLMITFYRETIKRDDQYIGVWEAIMEMLKSPYNSGGIDKVRFLKGRKSNFNKTFKDVSLKIQGGPWYITTLDIVRNLETFLDPEFENLYRYRFEQPVMYNGRVTWVIKFSRKEDVDFPCYYGKILIDADSYALVNAEFGLDKKSLKMNGETFIRKEPHGFTTRPEGAEYMVNYRMVDGRWQFYSARTDVIFKVKQNKENFKTEYRSVSDILVTQQYTFPRRARFGPDGLFRADDIFSDIIGQFDPEFWGNYNVIKPDDDLSKALLEVKTTEKDLKNNDSENEK
ncbi:MAG: carboxypeptidase-like regulatory domain-containing protein [Bacteroidia bacterium]|nr:carboxypeptidase-like regulatory domain-containing protein [Bacteroidia bacterium]